jgi:uncharacterized alkaline shock family protein YloU
MGARIENEKGELFIPTDVLVNLVGAATTKCYGVVGMAARNTKDGLVNLLKKDAYNRGVKVKIEEDLISIQIHIIVEYGVNISTICDNIIKNVRYSIENMTGFKVKNIEVNVESIRVDD